MTDTSSLQITGIDDTRPPMVRKENYIDLYFKLSAEAPADWCDDFNTLGHQIQPPAKIDAKTGLIINTYVHDMQLIQKQLDKIKDKVKQCNEAYLEKIRLKELAQAAKRAESGSGDSKQNLLNDIVSKLVY